MRAIRLRFTLGRMLTLVAVLGLASALVSERWRSDRRIAELQASLKSTQAQLPLCLANVELGDASPKVEVAGDRILIVASAHLYDRRSDPRYVWSVCISEPTGPGKVVFWKLYDKKVIRPTRGQNTATTFSDILRPDLPPGEYRIRVALFEIPYDAGLAPLNDEKARGGYVTISSNDIIRLGEDKGSLAKRASPMSAGDEARQPGGETAP